METARSRVAPHSMDSHEFPQAAAVLAMQAYLSERILRAGETVGQSKQLTSGILAGCSLGNKFTRVVLYDILECVSKTLLAQLAAPVETCQFVDDLATMAVANSDDDVTNTICSVALELRGELEIGKLTLSKKQIHDCQQPQGLGEESANNPETQRLPLSSGGRSAGFGH